MAKALSMNTQILDEAVNYKRTNDVPYFTPPTQFLFENKNANLRGKGSEHSPASIKGCFCKFDESG